MKKFYKVLLIAAIIVSVVAGFSVKSFASRNTYDTKALSGELSDALQNWIISNYSQYYKNINVNLSLEPNSVKVKDGTASAVFNTKIDLTLKAEKVEDLPFVKGMLKYYNSKKLTASRAQIEAANKLIDDWKLELKDYIGKPEPTANAEFKIAATVGKDGNIEKDSVKLYIEEPSLTNKGDDFYPVPSPMLETSEKMEKAGAEQMKETLQKALNSQIKTKSSFPYNRIAARDYANQYTSECQEGGYDTSFWNTSEYSCILSSDCADYVSQALHAGGILMDSIHDINHWWYSPSVDYSCWIYLDQSSNGIGLKKYMIDHNYWYMLSQDNFYNFQWTNAGNVIVIPNYHTMMIVLNDTVTREFSAHTTDRKQHLYYSSNGWEYYTVQKP